MLFNTISTASLALWVAATTAAPTASPSDPVCEDNYLVEKWGRVVTQPSWNSTRFGSFVGCQEKSALVSRQSADYQTTVEPDDSSALAYYLIGESKPYDQLWDRAVAELCGNTYCDGTKEISTDSGSTYGDLVLSLDGSFADSTMRDNFLSLIKDAFYKSIKTVVALEKINEDTFIGFAHATSGYGDASGYELTMRMTDRSDQPGCPGWVDTINSFGALVPELGTVFGLAGAICDSL